VPFTVKAFGAHDHMLEKVTEYPVDAVLLDSHTPGSGQTFDWSMAGRLPIGLRVILAGGLTPDNVGQAIEQVDPWGVDVSTGVESAPGRKDAVKVRRFINEAKAYEPDEVEDYAELGSDEVYDWEDDPAVDYRVRDDIAEA